MLTCGEIYKIEKMSFLPAFVHDLFYRNGVFRAAFTAYWSAQTYQHILSHLQHC